MQYNQATWEKEINRSPSTTFMPNLYTLTSAAPLSIHSAFSDVHIANFIGTNGPLYQQRYRLFELSANNKLPLLLSSEDVASIFSKKVFQISLHLITEQFYTSPQFWSRKDSSVSGSVSHEMSSYFFTKD